MTESLEKVEDKSAKEWYNLAFKEMHPEGDKEANVNKAMEYYSKCLELDPENAAALCGKGDILTTYLENDEEAIRCFDKALEINPNFAPAWCWKGLSLTCLGKYEKAMICYDKALEIYPNYDNAWYHKATAADKLGRNEDAEACYTKGEELKGLKEKCSRCIHKKPFNTCGCEKSSYYELNVEGTLWCERFERNPAQDHFSKGLAASIFISSETEPQDFKEVISEFETAVQLGLPADDKVWSLDALAGFYYRLGAIELESRKYSSDPELEKAIDQNENFSKGLEYFEKGVLLDAEQEHKVFVENEAFKVFNRSSSFNRFGLLYSLKSRVIKRRDGVNSAVSYLKEKLKLLGYIPGTHMSVVYLELGSL